MCDHPASALVRGAEAADDILRLALRLDVTKALNPQNPRDFLVIQRRIATDLSRATLPAQASVLRATLEGLDVDWPNMTAAARDRVIRAARSSLRGAARQATPAVEDVLTLHASDVAEASRRGAVARFNLDISSSLSLRDERLSEWCAESQTLFVRDRMGRRADSLSERARQIVAEGLDAGAGRDDIAERLAGLAEQGLGGGMGYWQVVAGAFVGRTRSAINVSSFEEAGVERFRVEAVLDEVTSEICRFLHGREFSVKKASAQIDEAAKLKDPEDIRALMPWVNKGKGDEDEDILYYGSSEDPQQVAAVDSFGEGEADRIGEYSDALSDAGLEDAGILTPPFHGHCRTTVVAVV